MATNADPTVAAAAASLASVDAAADDAFDQAITELPTLASEVPPPSTTEAPAQTEKAQEAGSPPVADAPVVAAPSLPPAGSEERRNLLAKFNGDEDAAAKAYWETNNRASELARKLAEYEEKYGKDAGSPPAQAAPTPAPVEIPADLKRYDDKIRATEETYSKTHTEFIKWKAEGARLDKEINGIFRQLSSRDLTLDKEALTEKLTQANAEREAVQYEIGTLQDRLNGLNDKWEDLKHNRGLAERLVAQERFVIEAREAKARSEEDAQVAAIRTQFNGTIDKLTADTSLVPEALAGRAKSYVIRAVKAQLADNLPIADIEKFTRDEITEFMAAAKAFHSAQSTEYAKLKQADAAMNAPTGPKAVASETKAPRADWTPAQWDQYLENAQL